MPRRAPAGCRSPSGLHVLLAVIVVVGYCWSVVLQIAALAEVQRLSILRAILSMVLLAAPLVVLGALAG